MSRDAAELELIVAELDCADEAAQIEGALGRLEAVRQVRTSVGAHKVFVRYDPARIEPTAIRAAVARLGMTVREDHLPARPRRPPLADLLGGLFVTAVALMPSLVGLGVAAVVAMPLFALARVPARLACRQVIPILWLLAFAVPVQVVLAGWEPAAMMALRLVLAVALAALYTLTTPVSATLDAMQALLRPFRRWVDPDRIGLALALAIRCVPLLAHPRSGSPAQQRAPSAALPRPLQNGYRPASIAASPIRRRAAIVSTPR